jgi:uncharacterized LabA/DUF88 family protein
MGFLISRPQEPEITYLFIDAGYLSEIYKNNNFLKQWLIDDYEQGLKNVNFELIKNYFKPRRVFYYDCSDEIRNNNETEEQYRDKLTNQKEFFNRIRSIEGFHVRLGTLTGRKKEKRQKEVDILLAVDMMNHAIRKNMTKAVLLSGDRDFKPLVESLIELGTLVYIAAEPKSISSEFRYSADAYTELTFNNLYSFLMPDIQSKYPIPNCMTNSLKPTSNLIKVGIVDNRKVEIYQVDNEFTMFLEQTIRENSLSLSFYDLERLELYYKLQYGKEIQWSS